MNERLIMGSNNPPAESEILKQRLEGYTKEEKLINDLVAREIPSEIDNDDMASELTDFIKSLKSARSTVEKIFKTEKEPFLVAGKIADTWKNVRCLKIDDSITKASKPIIVWNRKKEDAEKARQLELARRVQEEAERLAKEAEAHANAGIPDTAEELIDFAIEEEKKAGILIAKSEDIRGRSHGSFASASSRKVWVSVIDNTAILDLEVLRKYFKEDDINRAIRAAISDGVREISGVKIFEEDRLTIR